MRLYVMWNPPDGWVDEVRDLAEARQLIQRQYPRAVGSPWTQEQPDRPEGRMFVWKSPQAVRAGEREVAWVLSVAGP
jgi:hypothetical protein